MDLKDKFTVLGNLVLTESSCCRASSWMKYVLFMGSPFREIVNERRFDAFNLRHQETLQQMSILSFVQHFIHRSQKRAEMWSFVQFFFFHSVLNRLLALQCLPQCFPKTGSNRRGRKKKNLSSSAL